MKVAVVGTRGIPDIMGGIETHCQELYPRLAQMGVDVHVFGRRAYTKIKSPYVYRGVKVIPIYSPKIVGFEAFIHTFRCFLKVWKLHPDVVHLHAIGPSAIAPFFRLIGLKVIYTHHGQDYNRAKWGVVAKSILKLSEFIGTTFSNRVIVISKYLQDWLKKKYNCDRTNLIHNGVNESDQLDVEDADLWLSKHGLSNKHYIFALGRFVKEKGFHDLIDAFVKANLKDVSLVIAGTADHENEYSEELRAKAAAAGVILPGFIHGEELHAIFENASLFVIPSYHEGLPIVLLEALSYNLNVVASDIPANVEVPLPRECFYPVGDVDALSQKIKLFMESPVQRNYRQVIREHYNWDSIAEQTLEVYESVVRK